MEENNKIDLKQIWTTKKQSDGTLMITSYKGTETDVVIPDMIGKTTVSAIDPDTFSIYAPRITDEQKQTRDSITSVVIPGTIKCIPDKLLSGKKNLKKVVIEDGVKEIGYNAFGYCDVLESVTINGKIGKASSPFSNCYNLKDINSKNNKNLLCKTLVAGTGIEEFVFPEGTKGIPEDFFRFCKKLKKVTVPDSVKKIGAGAFLRCETLEVISISEDVQIGLGAFAYCDKLADENGIICINGNVYPSSQMDDKDAICLPKEANKLEIAFCNIPAITYKSAENENINSEEEAGYMYIGKFPEQMDFIMKPLKWRVLNIIDDRALVITEKAILGCIFPLCRALYQGDTWAESDIRNFLNETFVNTVFSETEKERIIETKLINDDNSVTKKKGGEDTLDKVFLLSLEEIQKYMPNVKDREYEFTEYAYQQIIDSSVGEKYRNRKMYMQSRTIGGIGFGSVAINGDDINYRGDIAAGRGIRPAMWIEID